MITLPRRSVTRFFIPLIDVLILLFCIFLLMPFVSAPGKADADTRADTPEELPTDVKALQDRVRQLEAQLADAKEQRDVAAGRLERFERNRLVRVLELDSATGDLYYFVGQQRKRLPERTGLTPREEDEEVARWVELQQLNAGGQDLYFLILYPRKPGGGHPTDRDLAKYNRWFQKVPHGFDVP